jgi:hypothetical protein
MRKRKTPVLLISALSVLALVIFYINLASAGVIGGKEGDQKEQAKDEPKSDQQVAEAMKDQLKSVVNAPTGAKANAPHTTTVAPEPTVVVPKQVTNKQKPNDNQTSGQWYDKDAHQDE